MLHCTAQAVQKFRKIVDQPVSFRNKTETMVVELSHIRNVQLPEYVFPDARRPLKKNKQQPSTAIATTATATAPAALSSVATKPNAVTAAAGAADALTAEASRVLLHGKRLVAPLLPLCF